MPKWIEDRVKELLNNKDFYPEMSHEKRKAIAYAIAWEQYKQKKKSSSEEEFDGQLNFKIIKSSIIESNNFNIGGKIAKGYEMFDQIKPLKSDSLIFQAQVQSERFRPESDNFGFILTKEAIDEALPDLAVEPTNVLYSSHRYTDEYAIGIVHAVDVPTRMSICEIFTGPNNPQGNIVAEGIRTGRIAGVSSSFIVKLQQCGICNSIGEPFLECGHYPNQKVHEKINKIKIRKIKYVELSTTPMPADPEALIIRHNSMFTLINSDETRNSSEIRDKFKNTNKQNDNNNIKNNTELLGSNNMEKTIDEIKEIKSTQSELLKKIEELTKMNLSLADNVKQKDVIISELQTQNISLANYINEINIKQKEALINQAIELKIKSGVLKPEKAEAEKNFLSSLNNEQLSYIIKSNQELISLKSGISAPVSSIPTTANVPVSPDNQSAVDKINAILTNHKLSKFVEQLKIKSQRKPKGGIPFEPIDENFLTPLGKPIKGEN